MASTLLNRATIAAPSGEREALTRLDTLLQRPHRGPAALTLGGEQAEVPPVALQLLAQCVRALSRDQAVTLMPLHRLLTTQEAADLLNVSRPYLVRLLDQGAIPHTKVGTHRRVRFADLLKYKEQRDARRREHMRRLSQLGQELDTRAADAAGTIG
jgi:excisionase family DNA binding protein